MSNEKVHHHWHFGLGFVFLILAFCGDPDLHDAAITAAQNASEMVGK